MINRKRVQRMMRQDNLLCLRRKKFIRTTDSEHGLAVYPNLVPTLDISAVNQLWVADITYIRLLREFVYLAVVLDAFSRRVIGWSLRRTLEAELAWSRRPRRRTTSGVWFSTWTPQRAPVNRVGILLLRVADRVLLQLSF